MNTPAVSYADMRDLATLPRVSVQVSAQPGRERGEVVVDLKNGGKPVAFFMHLRVVKAGTEDEIAPVFWEDNFVSLMPGESRVVTVGGLDGKVDTEVTVDGWNVEARRIPVARGITMR